MKKKPAKPAKPAKTTKQKKVKDLQLYTAAAKVKGGRGLPNTTMAVGEEGA